MNFDDTIRSRRSIRHFASTPVPEQAIRAVVETARLSPSAKNRQPWFFVVMSPSAKEAFADKFEEASRAAKNAGALSSSLILRTAPVAIAVYRKAYYVTDVLSIGAAMYSMCLKATDLGLGSLWIGDTDVLADDPTYAELAGVVLLGYSAEYPLSRPRKPIDEVSNLPAEPYVKVADDVGGANLQDTDFAFFSYSHCEEDWRVVTADICELKHHGIPLWYDKELIVGEHWDKHAVDVINQSNCIAMCMYVSYHSLASPAVFKEFSAALAKQKTRVFPVIPIVIGEQSITEILSEMKQNGLTEFALAYERYFGSDNQTLYIKRNLNPSYLQHIEQMIATFTRHKIISDPRVYDNFKYEIVNDACTITRYEGVAADVVVPSFVSGYAVEIIGANAFSRNKTLRSVVLPDTVKRLAAGVFYGSALSQILLPDSVEEIQTACFRECYCLVHIDLPPRITYLAEALFRECVNLTEIVAPMGVTEMKEAVFRGCVALRRAVLPPTLRVMTEGGFNGCTALEELIISPEVEGAESWSFDTSPHLKRVQISGFVFEKGKGTPIG